MYLYLNKNVVSAITSMKLIHINLKNFPMDCQCQSGDKFV